MILKLMLDNGLGSFDPPDNPRRACRILDNVIEANVKTLGTGEQAVEVIYSVPNRGLDSEIIVLNYVAFLMNNAGKTIQMLLPTDGYTPHNVPSGLSEPPKNMGEAIKRGRGGEYAITGTPQHLAEAQNRAAASYHDSLSKRHRTNS